jgi:hypothetical protein
MLTESSSTSIPHNAGLVLRAALAPYVLDLEAGAVAVSETSMRAVVREGHW